MDILFFGLGDEGVVGGISRSDVGIGCISAGDGLGARIDGNLKWGVRDGRKFLFREDKAKMTVFASSLVGGDGHCISEEFGAEALER